MITQQFRKLQNAVCDVSTGYANGNHYYDSVGSAINAVDEALKGYDHCIDPTDWMIRANGADFSSPYGCRIVVRCNDSSDRAVCDAILSFYRMESGRYELTAYLA